MTFERFLKEYFGPHIDANYSPANVEKAIYICKAALPFLRGRAIRSIRPADIERFIESRKNTPTMHDTLRKPATVLRELSVISKLFSLAVKNDLCDHNPCSRVERPKFDNTQNRLLGRADQQRFLAALPSQWARDICTMVLNTGLRQNDLMTLTRFSIDREERLIRLVQGKTKRRVEIACNATVMEILERRWQIKNQLLFPSPRTGTENGSVRHTMQRTCDKLEIPRVTIRDLRRTFATRALENGSDGVTVAEALGHTSLRMIPRYVRSLENKRKLAESLENPAKIPPRLILPVKQPVGKPVDPRKRVTEAAYHRVLKLVHLRPAVL